MLFRSDYLSEGNPTVADAILDRLVSGAIRIKLRGGSMRRLRVQRELGQVEEETNPTAAKAVSIAAESLAVLQHFRWLVSGIIGGSVGA